jgi:geranylgeranyl pyrophosphate synthase
MIHCYTLVHDDLPSMDNDELRRGRPTVWKAYGEPMALLVGDSLQTLGFELLADAGDARVLREMARALGDLGVARGQVRDTFLRHDTLSLDELLRIHDEKTGVFIASCLVCGARLGGADETMVKKLRSLGILLGRAFQIQDDILDAEGTADTVGKKTGKDASLGKGIVSLMGLRESKAILATLESDMLTITRELSDPCFADITDFVVHRQH